MILSQTFRLLALAALGLSVAGCTVFQRDTLELPPPPQGNIIATATSTPQTRQLDEFDTGDDTGGF